MYQYNEPKFIWELKEVHDLLTFNKVDPVNVKVNLKDLLTFIENKVGLSFVKARAISEGAFNTFTLCFKDGVFHIHLKTGVLEKVTVNPADFYLLSIIEVFSYDYVANTLGKGLFDSIDNIIAEFPVAKSFLESALDLNNPGLSKKFIRLFFCLASLLYLKNYGLAFEAELQRLFLITGIGGSGKSTVIH